MDNNFKVVAGTGKITKVSTPKDGVGMADIYIYPEQSLQVEAQFAMINKLFSPSFFNELRTNQQLGYAVFSLDYEIHDYPTIGMTIVSDNTNLQDLKEKMMEFQYGFAAALESVDNKIIKNVQTALLEDLNQKPENIFVEVSPLINDWEEGNYNFDTRKKVINHISNTSRQDLVNLNNKFILDGEFMNVTIQIRGNDFDDSSYFSWENF
jgi:protease-3